MFDFVVSVDLAFEFYELYCTTVFLYELNLIYAC